MGSDDIHKRKKRERKKRKESILDIAPYRYLIVCEGEKTEPYYFEGLKKILEKKFKNKIDIRKFKFNEQFDFIDINGTGRNTESLIEYTLKLQNKANIPYGHIWCVFDKDSFSDQQFNNAIHLAESYGFKSGWSNEAIELWFLLHFEFLNSGITRDKYINKLNRYFSQYNLNDGKYEKNLENIFDILNTYGNQGMAIANAKRLIDATKTPTENNPATTVYQLIESIIDYL